MDHSITFRNGDESYNTFDDWHLIAPSRPSIAPAQPKSNYVDILGANGSLDFSEALVGKPTYSDREGSWEFVVLNPGDVDQYSLFDAEDRGRYLWQKIYDKIQEAIHGRTFNVILDDDPDCMYKGRLWMNEWRSNAGWSRIVINYRLRPYKYDKDGNIIWPEYAYGSSSDDDDSEIVLSFIGHPVDASVSAGSEATFNATVAGVDRTLLWQVSSDGTNWVDISVRSDTYNWIESRLSDISTTTTLYVSTPSASTTMNGYKYRCVASDQDGNTITSNVATLTVVDSSGEITIEFTSSDRTITVGEITSFWVTASTSNPGATLSYQWQVDKGSIGWDNIENSYMFSGAKSNRLEVSTLDQNGDPDEGSVYYPGGSRFRCVITDSTGAQVVSEPRSLTVVLAPRVSISPLVNSAQGQVGDTSTVNIYASATGGQGSLSYLWEHNYSGSWEPFSSSGSVVSSSDWTSSSITITVNHLTEGTDGVNVRCTVTDSSGTSATSTSTSYIQIKTTDDAVRFTTQPSDTTAEVGDSAYFTAEVSGDVAAQMWQYKSPGSTTWQDANTWSKASGVRSSTLVISDLELSDSGTQVRLRINTDPDYTVLYSDAATLTVEDAEEQEVVTIIRQPASTSGAIGDTVTLSCIGRSSTGGSLRYQWMMSANGSNWSSVWGSEFSGGSTASLSVTVTEDVDDYVYRCDVYNHDGSVGAQSDTATITITSSSVVKITSQPEDRTIEEGDTATFRIDASGSGVTYQWQYMSSSGSSWTNFNNGTTASGTISGATGRVLYITTVAGSSAWNGVRIRCVAQDSSGNTATSNTVTLYVN